MTNIRHIAALLAAVSLVSCGRSSLDCSGAEATDTVTRLLTKLVMGELKPEEAAVLPVTTKFDNIRTISATDKAHVCRATLTMHVAYTGPMPGPPDADAARQAVDDAVDSVMKAASVPDAAQTAVRQTKAYTDPAFFFGIRPGETLVANTRTRASMVQAAIGGSMLTQADFYRAQSTDAFMALQSQDATDLTERSRFAYAEAAELRAQQSSGEIGYTVSLTDEGKPYVSLDNNSN